MTEIYFRSSNFCKDHRDKIKVPDPLVVKDLISDKLPSEILENLSLHCLISLANFRLKYICFSCGCFSEVYS